MGSLKAVFQVFPIRYRHGWSRWLGLGHGFGLGVCLLAAAGCSSAKKKVPELSELLGKKIALIEIDGEATARTTVEVALANEIARRGTFILIPKLDLQKARVLPHVDPTDPRSIGKAAGADWAMKVSVKSWDSTETEGYDAIEEEEDSLLKKETGSGKSSRLAKVKLLKTTVEIEVELIEVDSDDVRKGTAREESSHRAVGTEGRPKTPWKLSELEKVAGRAFRAFFDRYE